MDILPNGGAQEFFTHLFQQYGIATSLLQILLLRYYINMLYITKLFFIIKLYTLMAYSKLEYCRFTSALV